MNNDLYQLNEDELFYKEYYTAKNTPETFKKFISQLDEKDIKKRKLLIPELFPDNIPYYMNDNEYFDLDNHKTIYLSKHNRYTPFFLHQHIFFEFIYVVKGKCQHVVTGQNMELKEGDLCLFAPSIFHAIVANDDDSVIMNILIRRSTFEDTFFNILRDKNIISTFLMNNLYAKNRDPFLIFHTHNDADIKNMIIEMYNEQTHFDNYTDRIVGSMLTILLSKIVRCHMNNIELSSHSLNRQDETFPILNYILDHYSTITLQQLANQLNYSIPYCSKYIKSVTGYSFRELHRNILMNKAESLLKTSSLSIQSISHQLGYENPENFMRAFKERYHMTPTQFRQTIE